MVSLLPLSCPQRTYLITPGVQTRSWRCCSRVQCYQGRCLFLPSVDCRLMAPHKYLMPRPTLTVLKLAQTLLMQQLELSLELRLELLCCWSHASSR